MDDGLFRVVGPPRNPGKCLDKYGVQISIMVVN
jgi:hypothetical protein